MKNLLETCFMIFWKKIKFCRNIETKQILIGILYKKFYKWPRKERCSRSFEYETNATFAVSDPSGEREDFAPV